MHLSSKKNCEELCKNLVKKLEANNSNIKKKTFKKCQNNKCKNKKNNPPKRTLTYSQ